MMGKSRHSLSSRAGHVTTEMVYGQTLALWLGNGDEHCTLESDLTKCQEEPLPFTLPVWIETDREEWKTVTNHPLPGRGKYLYVELCHLLCSGLHLNPLLREDALGTTDL